MTHRYYKSGGGGHDVAELAYVAADRSTLVAMLKVYRSIYGATLDHARATSAGADVVARLRPDLDRPDVMKFTCNGIGYGSRRWSRWLRKPVKEHLARNNALRPPLRYPYYRRDHPANRRP